MPPPSPAHPAQSVPGTLPNGAVINLVSCHRCDAHWLDAGSFYSQAAK
jgi:hypothetical protein